MSPTHNTNRAVDRHDYDAAAAAFPAGRQLWQELNSDWERICTTPGTRHILPRWRRTEPDLPAGELQDLILAIRTAPTDQRDRALLALIRLSHAGQQLAGRALLELMLPKLYRIARSLRRTHTGDALATPNDVAHHVVAAFWTALTTYSTDTCTTGVAGTLGLNALRQATRPSSRSVPAVLVDHNTLAEISHARDTVDHADSVLDHLDWQPTPDAELPELLAWGIDTGAITTDHAQALILVYQDPDPATARDRVAAQLGVTPAVIRKRCSRGRQRLIAAVRAANCDTITDQPAAIPC